MNKVLRKSSAIAFAIVTGILTFVPEELFKAIAWAPNDFSVLGFKNTSGELNSLISRLLILIAIWTIAVIACALYFKLRRQITIKGRNYTVQVEYGDLLKAKNCKRVISFDECFSTHIGDAPEDINVGSICGQYLVTNSDVDISSLIKASGLKPARTKSKYHGKERFESGSIVPNGDDLLLAFARLDENGRGGFFSYDEYLDCLNRLWEEIDKHYGQKDVCVPILGAGTTRMDGPSGASLSQQDLLDIMIWSYKLCHCKIKEPNKLRIICKPNRGFSLNKIDQ